MSCNCGKPKCKGQCGCKSPAVLQINNPSTYVSFHKVTIPASMGDSTTNPPENGKYRNVLVHYDADNTSWLYSSDGIPTKITGPQGPQGEQGPAGTITIGTTTTGDTGTDAEVENVGTPENAILNFTIPRGEQGEQGVQGETGPQGYMNEQDVRDVVDTIVPDGFFDGEATVSDCGTSFELDDTANVIIEEVTLHGDTRQSETPTPASPASVQTVTGEQEFSIGGTNYIVDLGNIELCKLGSREDFIYRSNGDWYLHKAIGKSILVGTGNTFGKSGNSSNNSFYYTSAANTGHYAFIDIDTGALPTSSSSTTVPVAFSNYLKSASPKTVTSTNSVGFTFDYLSSTNIIELRMGFGLSSSITTTTLLRNWLDSTKPSFYYYLATPTDTRIADYTLIKQLDKLSYAKSLDARTEISATGTLPAIICVEAFTNNWNGAISGITNELNQIYSKNEIDNLLEEKNLEISRKDSAISDGLYLGRIFSLFFPNGIRDSSGSCLIDDNTYVLFMKNQDHTSTHGGVCKIDLETRQMTFYEGEYGFANSACYNAQTNKIYTTTYGQPVSVINPTTFVVEQTISTIDGISSVNDIHSLAYDRVTDKMYLQVASSPRAIYEYDPVNNSATLLCEFDTGLADCLTPNHGIPNDERFHQGISAYNGQIWYLISGPEMSALLKIETDGSISEIKNLPREVFIFSLWEAESIAFNSNGDIVMASVAYSVAENGKYGEQWTAITAHNFYGNKVGYDNYWSSASRQNHNVDIHVDASKDWNYSIYQDGSEDYPFRSFEEAMAFLQLGSAARVVVDDGRLVWGDYRKTKLQLTVPVSIYLAGTSSIGTPSDQTRTNSFTAPIIRIEGENANVFQTFNNTYDFGDSSVVLDNITLTTQTPSSVAMTSSGIFKSIDSILTGCTITGKNTGLHYEHNSTGGTFTDFLN